MANQGKICVYCKSFKTLESKEPCLLCEGFSEWERTLFVSESGRPAAELKAREESDGCFEIIDPDGEFHSFSQGVEIKSKIKK